MSEIASKSSTGASSSLLHPFAKKDKANEHDVMFAALFGGVVAVENDTDPLAVDRAITRDVIGEDAGLDNNPDGETDVLLGMQAVANMMLSQEKKDQKNQMKTGGANDADEVSLADVAWFDGEALEIGPIEVDQDPIVNSAIIGPMPLQQNEQSFKSTQPSGSLAKMAFEDEVPNTPRRPIQIGPTFVSQNVRLAGEKPSSSVSVVEIQGSQQDIEDLQLDSARRTPQKLGPSLAHTLQTNTAASKSVIGPERTMFQMSSNGDMQYENPEEFLRAITGQVSGRADGAFSRQVVDITSGDNTPTNAARLALASGSAAGGQMSQQNNGQSAGQSGGSVASGSGMTNGSMMEMLDMAQDNWTEMLLQRVEKGLAGGKDKIDFHLNPRNLGKMRISLIVQNDRTNIHIQTETTAAAQVLNDSEARLAQMMDASGVKFGSLTSQYSQSFAGHSFGQNSGRHNGTANPVVANSADGDDNNNAEISVEASENLINMQA